MANIDGVPVTFIFFFSSDAVSDAAEQITKALQSQQAFVLYSSHGRSAYLFSVQHLTSAFISIVANRVEAAVQHNSLDEFNTTVSMALLSHKKFGSVTPEQLQAFINFLEITKHDEHQKRIDD
jgi:hypothetical protein